MYVYTCQYENIMQEICERIVNITQIKYFTHRLLFWFDFYYYIAVVLVIASSYIICPPCHTTILSRPSTRIKTSYVDSFLSLTTSSDAFTFQCLSWLSGASLINPIKIFSRLIWVCSNRSICIGSCMIPISRLLQIFTFAIIINLLQREN